MIHVDFKEHNTNQIGSGLPHSHLILASNVSTSGKEDILDFSSLTSIRSRIRLRRNIMQRGFRITNVSGAGCSFYCVTVDDTLMKQSFTISPGKGKIFKGTGSTAVRRAGENRIGEETRNLRSTLSDRPGTGWQKNRIPAC